MTEYHKIQTILKRDPDNNFKTLLSGMYAKPEFEALKDLQWVWTEKVDGMNIRVDYRLDDGVFHKDHLDFLGKTDRAELHKDLVSALEEMFPIEVFRRGGKGMTLYGEGYGAGIQKGGGRYREDKSFVLFDVKVEDRWLSREEIQGVVLDLGIECVPEIGRGNLEALLNLVRITPRLSRWGDFQAEGIVARPPVEMFNQWGERIICKIKAKDFLR